MADEHVPGKECYMKLPESIPVGCFQYNGKVDFQLL